MIDAVEGRQVPVDGAVHGLSYDRTVGMKVIAWPSRERLAKVPSYDPRPLDLAAGQ
jgi:hypothetical protein